MFMGLLTRKIFHWTQPRPAQFFARICLMLLSRFLNGEDEECCRRRIDNQQHCIKIIQNLF